jgi:iron-sulfur cluster assembly protein
MIEISALAAEKLGAHLSANQIESPVRIAVMNGCGGPRLSLYLDERHDNDLVQEHEGLTLLLARDLADYCGKVTVQYIEEMSGCGCGDGGGFSLTSEKPLPGANTGCGGSCSSNGCNC